MWAPSPGAPPFGPCPPLPSLPPPNPGRARPGRIVAGNRHSSATLGERASRESGCRGRLRERRWGSGTVLPPALTRGKWPEWSGVEGGSRAALCLAQPGSALPLAAESSRGANRRPSLVLSASPTRPLPSPALEHSDPAPQPGEGPAPSACRPRPPFPLAAAVREGAEPGRHTESKRGECGRGVPATRGSRGREVAGVRLGERRAGQAGLGLGRVPRRVGVWGCPGRRSSRGVGGPGEGRGRRRRRGWKGPGREGPVTAPPGLCCGSREGSGMRDCRTVDRCRLTPRPRDGDRRMPQEGRPPSPPPLPEPSGIRQTGRRRFAQGRRYDGLACPQTRWSPQAFLGLLLAERHSE